MSSGTAAFVSSSRFRKPSCNFTGELDGKGGGGLPVSACCGRHASLDLGTHASCNPFPRQLTNVSSWKVFYGRHDHVQLVDGCRRGTPDTGIQVQEFIEDEQWRNGKPGQYQRPCPLLGQTPCPFTEHSCVHASPSLQLFLNPRSEKLGVVPLLCFPERPQEVDGLLRQ